MKIRQVVRRITSSLAENPNDWKYGNHFPEKVISNSRGIDIFGRIRPYLICLRDKWDHSTQLFYLNDKEIDFLSPTFSKVAKKVNKSASIEKSKKRRAWLVTEILKTL